MNVHPSPHFHSHPVAPATATRSKRTMHSILAVTRYASLEPASISAAVRDGLSELLAGSEPRDRIQAFVYFRNRQGSTVTLEIGLPLQAALPAGTINGALKRRQNTARLLIDTGPAQDGLARAMDEAVRVLDVPSRTELPDLWQVFDLPDSDYRPGLPLAVGFVRNHHA